MKRWFFLGTILQGALIVANTEGFDLLNRSVVTDPSISRQCRNLLEDRDNKLKIKHSLGTLRIRNRRLQRVVPEEKKTLMRKLKHHEALVVQKIAVASQRIQTMEESLVRRGCPRVDFSL